MSFRSVNRFGLYAKKINVKSTGAKLLFTLPSYCRFVPVDGFIICNEASGVSATPTATIGTNAPTYNNYGGPLLTALNTSGETTRFLGSPEGTTDAGGTSVYLNVTGAGTATGNYNIDVYIEFYMVS